jgi:glutathione synthase/RimK-type ligase-like ATP-grasp enzyme
MILRSTRIVVVSGSYVAIATATSTAKEDFDEAPLREALAAAGVEARWLAWDDPGAQAGFAGAAACVIRSTWNYVRQHERFLAWVDQVAAQTRLFNPAPVIRWNSHKRYLLQLEARGVPIVPTRLLAKGNEEALADVIGDWDDVVVKPAVSAGSFGTVRAQRADLRAGEAHLRTFLRERDMLVQRYEPAVEGPGERSLVWIDGALSHAVRKQARFLGDQERVSSQAMPIADDERALAQQVLALAPRPLLYARVDMVRDPQQRPRLMELELIEPSLFFACQPGSAARLAAAIAARVVSAQLAGPST